MSNPIPEPRTDSYWTSDPAFRALLARALGPQDLAWVGERCERMGLDAVQIVAPRAAICDRFGPRLERYDERGDRVDRVVHRPEYREMERVVYGSGMVAAKYDPAARAEHPAALHAMGFSLGYLFGQAEAGIFCPVCMTDGAARVLDRFAPAALRERCLPHLAARDLGALWRGAMFLTEKQGGSDVGASESRAEPADGGMWRLTGDKWFCSSVDSEVALVLARPDGAPEGTRGLALFALIREGVDPIPGVRIERIKDKLGVRSMATGEVELRGAPAWLVAGPGEGFKRMLEMVNYSRLYNAVAAVAVMRRALYEAVGFGRGRKAFGKRLVDHPLQRRALADVAMEWLGAMHLAFAAVLALDRADGGDREALSLLRGLVPVAKAWTGKHAVWAASECLEAIGGNAYIEESVMPRLLRDAQVLPVWEGTTNIQTLDFLRAVAKHGAGEALDRAVAQALESAPEAAGKVKDRVAKAWAAARDMLALARADPDLEADARALVERAARALAAARLCAQGGEAELAAAARLCGLGPDARSDLALLEVC